MEPLTVKATSLYEPWASLMRAGAKRIETRPTRIHYTGPLLICAGQSRKALQTITPPIKRKLVECGYETEADLHFGHAVALVNVTGWKSTEELWNLTDPKITMAECLLGNYEPGRFGWITEPLCLDFKPFPVTGKQGQFNVEVPDELRPYLAPF